MNEELDKKVASFESWDAEKKRYHMKDFGGGTIALGPTKRMVNRRTAYARTATKRDGCQFSSQMEGMPLSKKCICAPAATGNSNLAPPNSAI